MVLLWHTYFTVTEYHICGNIFIFPNWYNISGLKEDDAEGKLWKTFFSYKRLKVFIIKFIFIHHFVGACVGRALDVAELGGGANFILSDQPINIEHAYDVIHSLRPLFQWYRSVSHCFTWTWTKVRADQRYKGQGVKTETTYIKKVLRSFLKRQYRTF